MLNGGDGALFHIVNTDFTRRGHIFQIIYRRNSERYRSEERDYMEEVFKRYEKKYLLGAEQYQRLMMALGG